MSDLLDRLRTLFFDRPPRERLLISIAIGVFVTAAIWLGVVGPIVAIAENGSQRIEVADQQLRVMRRLIADYDESQQQLSSVENRIAEAPRGNLRTALESLAKQVSLSIDSMEPQAAPTHPSYQETKVEVGLRSVTLSQLVNYLHRIEDAPEVYSIKSLRIKTRPDRSELLDVNFSISAFEPI